MSQQRARPNIEGMTSLKIDNLLYQTTEENLKRHFEKYGEIGDVYIPKDRYSREGRGFAFVRYYDRRDAEDAMECMNGRQVDGRVLRVQIARDMRPKAPPYHYTSGSGGRPRPRTRSHSRSRSPSPSSSKGDSYGHDTERYGSKSPKRKHHQYGMDEDEDRNVNSYSQNRGRVEGQQRSSY